MQSVDRQQGFTLIDLTVSLVLASLVMAFVSRVGSETVPRWRLEQAAEDIAAGLRATRTKAIFDGQEQAILFDPVHHRYQVAEGSIGDRVTGQRDEPTNRMLRVVKLNDQLRFARPPAATEETRGGVGTAPPENQSAINLSRPGAPTGRFEAVFSSRGLLTSSTSPGHIYLGDVQRKLYRRIAVNAFGLVTVERQVNGKWVS